MADDVEQIQITTRVDRRTARELRMLAAAQDTTTTCLIARGVHDVLIANGREPSEELRRIARVA